MLSAETNLVDEDLTETVYPIDIAGMETNLGVMWSLSDFTEESGGTRVVPDSHRLLRSWNLTGCIELGVRGDDEGIGCLLPGLDLARRRRHRSSTPRLGLIYSCCLGWLRPEVNQCLITPEVATQYSPRVRALLGYMARDSGDDLCGSHRGDCPAWVDTPPDPAWNNARGTVGTLDDARGDVKSYVSGRLGY